MVILPQSCFTCGDEVAWGGQIQTADRVKSLVTSTTIRVELKGKEAYEVNDFRWFVVLSNSDWPVRVGERDRRYYVVSTSDEYRGIRNTGTDYIHSRTTPPLLIMSIPTCLTLT